MTDVLQVLDAGLPGPARGLFSTRVGGVSGAGYDDANLSLRSDDEPRRTLANRDLLARAAQLTAADLAFAQQVHGAEVGTITAAPSRRARHGGIRGADALVTTRHGIGLATLAADCAPVLLADPVAGVLGAAHCGRPGLVAGILPATVAAMTEAGADPGRLTAVVGPCIGGCCYELPTAMADAVGVAVPTARSTTRAGTPSIDLRAGAEAQLQEAGVGTVRHVGGCTLEQPALFYSYRRDGTADRHGGLVWLP